MKNLCAFFAIVALLLGMAIFFSETGEKPDNPTWEKVNSSTYRMEVEGGWIYETLFDGKKGMVFVPKTQKENQ